MSSQQIFLIAAALALAVLLGRALAGRIDVPDAAAYVLIGVAAALVPGMPIPHLSPDVVLLLFLPPLVYYAAFFTDPRQTMQNIAPVIGQSVGLVLATAVAVAGTLLLVFPDMGWAPALAFGAAIAPPDPVAATTVMQRLGVPGRVVTVLEGEGLINDAVALTLFGIALANVGATPTTGAVLLGILIAVAGGVAFGLVVGIAVSWLRMRTPDVLSRVVWSLATPYLAFIPAQQVHASGVLATVTAAVWLGRRGRGVAEPTARLQTETFWRVLNLLLVAFLFVLLGFQVPGIVTGVSHYLLGTLLLVSASVIVVIVAIRLMWVLWVPSLLARLGVRGEGPARLSRAERVLLGWCGPRGAVSLAVALSIPLTASGVPFIRRELLLFLTVVVVMVTLEAQVMLVPALVSRLRLSPDELERTEGLRARRATVNAALRELENAEAGVEHEPAAVHALRHVLELRRDSLLQQLDAQSGHHSDTRTHGEVDIDGRALRQRLIETERRTLHQLHADGHITARTMHEISEELNLDEARLHSSEGPPP